MWPLFLIRTYSTAAFAAHLPPCQPEYPCLGTVSDCLHLAFAKIAHILIVMHLQFLKTLSYSQLLASFISQLVKFQQVLTVSMTSASSLSRA